MSETTPTARDSKIADYVAHHPGAIVDEEKAEVMAHASKGAEEKVVEYKEEAQGRLDIVIPRIDSRDDEGNLVFLSDRRGSAEEYKNTYQRAQRAIERAQEQRARADAQAQVAGESYETLKNIN